ncbi:MAG: TfoX/Sxy family protein [Rhizobiales bacterium]|nr:TfoX/Sxy family protein [Hyphomicrobiales bacterium]
MSLDQRLRQLLAPHGAESKRMFGGTCFLIGGNMLIGTLKDGLIVRVGKEAHGKAIGRKGARTFDMTGRPMEGFVSVDGDAVKSDAALRQWVDLALAFVHTLPPKAKKPAKDRKR